MSLLLSTHQISNKAGTRCWERFHLPRYLLKKQILSGAMILRHLLVFGKITVSNPSSPPKHSPRIEAGFPQSIRITDEQLWYSYPSPVIKSLNQNCPKVR